MKVLENRNATKIHCPYCNSSLAITAEDVKYHDSMGHALYLYVPCGACWKDIRLDAGTLPNNWQPKINDLYGDD